MPSDTYILTISDAGVSVPATNSVTNASVADNAAIAFSKLASLTSGNVLVGNSSNVPTSVAVTGDVTISNTGVTSIASGAIVNADVNSSAGIAHSKLASMSSGNILVGSSGSVPTSVAMTGDVTISNAGLTTIANDAVTFGKMQNVSGYSIVGKPTTGSGDVAEIGSSSFMLEASTGFLRQADAAAARSTLGLGALSTQSSISVETGGTGQTSYTVGDILYANGATSLAKLAGVATGNVLISGGVATAPSYGKVGLATHVSGTLPVANGGTNQTSYAVGDILFASTTTALSKLAGVATGNVLISGGVATAPSYGKVGLTTHVTGTLPVANGGTGIATLTGYVKGTGTTAMTANPTIPVADISGTLPVANGGTGKTTFDFSGPLYYDELTDEIDVGGPLQVSGGGTGQTSYAVGDILFASTTTALSKLAGVATGNVLISGGVATAPSYGKVGLATHVSGTLPVANGGTGVTQSAYGECYISSVAATPIATAGTFVKVSGTTTAGTLSNFTHTTSNRLTYTGTTTRKFLVTAALSFHGTGTNDYKFAFNKNVSTILTPSIISTTGTGAGNLAHVSCQTIVELATNDYIEVHVTNADATNSATVDFMNVTAVAII